MKHCYNVYLVFLKTIDNNKIIHTLDFSSSLKNTEQEAYLEALQQPAFIKKIEDGYTLSHKDTAITIDKNKIENYRDRFIRLSSLDLSKPELPTSLSINFNTETPISAAFLKDLDTVLNKHYKWEKPTNISKLYEEKIES